MASLTSLLCLLVVTGSVIMTTESRRINDGWIHFGNGLKYALTTSKNTWRGVRQWCQRVRGDLATSGMRHYWTRVAIANTMLLKNEFVWIGLSDLVTERRWNWVDGTTATRSNTHWWSGEPNNRHNEDCGGINLGRDFRTNDADCDEKFYGLCEARI